MIALAVGEPERSSGRDRQRLLKFSCHWPPVRFAHRFVIAMTEKHVQMTTGPINRQPVFGIRANLESNPNGVGTFSGLWSLASHRGVMGSKMIGQPNTLARLPAKKVKRVAFSPLCANVILISPSFAQSSVWCAVGGVGLPRAFLKAAQGLVAGTPATRAAHPERPGGIQRV